MDTLSLYFIVLILSVHRANSDPIPTTPPAETTTTEKEELNIGEARRILRGQEVTDTWPYMVYLRPTQNLGHVDKNWLCGGVIIDESYILTSAACIEDVTYFYVVSGTHRWLPGSKTNECIENGAVRAIWKCVSRSYRFDGHVFNNIRWMVNDIAVVMIEGAISFTRRVKGCDFIPQRIEYNNMSIELEKPGTRGFIAGWGSVDKYTDAADILARTSVNSPNLMEAETVIITKEHCVNRWLERYTQIIEKYMICGKVMNMKMNKKCDEQHSDCRQLMYSEEEGPRIRRFENNPDKLILDSAAAVKKMERAKNNTRRMLIATGYTRFGGFCENDHGGPLIVGRGNGAIVVGIISAYRTENNSKLCYGPFLYTSVYNNRHLIHCALHKTEGNDCSGLMRDQSSVLEEESFDWGNMPLRQRTIYDDESASDSEAAPSADNGTAAPPRSKNTSPSDGQGPNSITTGSILLIYELTNFMYLC